MQESARIHSPYEFLRRSAGHTDAGYNAPDDRRLYHPFYVEGPYDKREAVTIFPRDPRTGLQVWSGDSGYPGDENYLDFHKKRWPGGHRYWRVTGPRVDIGDKQPYIPSVAAERIRDHANHFVDLVYQALEPGFNDSVPPVLCSPFDAELFGHWWFEGVQWLETVARILHDYDTGVSLITCSSYLDQYPRGGFLALHEGSWGAEGNNQVWLNGETTWTYRQLYAAELACRDICTSSEWQDGGLGERVVKQLCRELLLLESSDWQFLITTGAARDYAELRFNTHHDQFNELGALWDTLRQNGHLSDHQASSVSPSSKSATTSLPRSTRTSGPPAHTPLARLFSPTALPGSAATLHRTTSSRLPWTTAASASFPSSSSRSIPAPTMPMTPSNSRSKPLHNHASESSVAKPRLTLVPAAAPRQRTRRSPLALWHLLSLDAPSVATVWTSSPAPSAVGLHPSPGPRQPRCFSPSGSCTWPTACSTRDSLTCHPPPSPIS